MKQYMLSVYMPEGFERTDEELQQAFKDVDAFNQKLQDQGAWVFAGGLNPPETATVVTAVDGEILLTDGPFAEAKEQVGGFWVITAPDLDGALAWAKEATVACQGAVEVRPFQDDSDTED
jgi:hypothetical protein